MTNESIMDLANKVRQRYRKATKQEKTAILDEFCKNTGYHRKAAIRAINRISEGKKRAGRRVLYHKRCDLILKEVWRLMDYICAERFYPKIGKTLDQVSNTYRKEDVALVKKMSLATVKRRIGNLPRPGAKSRKKNKWQKTYDSIPINSNLRKATVFGYLGVDFVEHCGGDLRGEFCRTLTFTDIKTLWTTNSACYGKKQQAVETAADICLSRFPECPINELHPDNEPALLAVMLLKRKARENMIATVTRSRPGKKNDNCNVEERNNERVRKHVGYKRYAKRHLSILNMLYSNLDDYCNFFIPSMKLNKKIYDKRTHRLIKKVYDEPMTPYERILQCKEIDSSVKSSLMKKYASLDILHLRNTIDKHLTKLFRL